MAEVSDILVGALDGALLPPRYFLLSAPEVIGGVFLDGFGADLGFVAPSPDPTPVVDPDAPPDLSEFSSFIPPSLGLGSVLSTTVRTVTIRNDTAEPWTLTSIVPHDAAGVTVALVFGTLPITLDPLDTQAFTVTVVATGAERLNARIEFIFGVAGTYDFYVSAIRAPTFTFRPNWAEPVTERLTWMTDVITAFNGNEWRMGLRQRPRRQLELTVAALLDDRELLDSTIVGLQDSRVIAPLWFDRQHLGTAVDAGDTVLLIDATDREYVVGGYVVITNGLRVVEVGVVSAIGVGTVTLDAPLGQSFPANALVSPGFAGTFQPSIAGSAPTAGIATARIVMDFLDLPLYTATEEDNGTYSTYDSKPVSLRVPNRAEDVTVDYKRLRDTVDYDVGQVEFRARTNRTFNVRSYSYYLRDRRDRMNFRKWLAARHGQANPFLYPVWERNFELTSGILSTDTVLYVKDQKFADFVSSQLGRRRIALKTTAGVWHYATISSILAHSEGVEAITLTVAFGANVPLATIVIAMFLEYCVLNSDAIELNYPVDSASTVKFAVRSVIA